MNHQNKFGRTVLMEAVQDKNESVIELLLDGGAGVKPKDTRGRNALDQILESCRDCREIIKALLTAGARTDIRPAILYRYIEQDDLEMIKLLVKAGADINTRDEENRSALIVAVGQKNPAMVDYLLAAGVEVNPAMAADQRPLFHIAALASEPQILERLMQAGIDIKARDQNGNTALHQLQWMAVAVTWPMSYDVEQACIATMLIEAGLDVNAVNDAG